MPTELSITEVKANFETIVDRVEAGEDVIVTRWGKPYVRMVSYSGGLKTIADVGAENIQNAEHSARSE